MKTNVQVYRELDSQNSYKMCENTHFFPIALSLLSYMSIEPLMHSECLVCTCFQAPLAMSRISTCKRVDTQNSFPHKRFAWLKVNSYILK